MQFSEAATTAASVPRTGTRHDPAADGLTSTTAGTGSMSLAERLKQAAMSSALGVGRAPADGEPPVPALSQVAALLAGQTAFRGPGSPPDRGAVKAEHSSGGSGDFSGLLRGDGSGSAAGGQGLDDIMKQARALMEADAALVRDAPSGAGAARGGMSAPAPPRADRLLRAGRLASVRGLGGTQSMPHDLNVRLSVFVPACVRRLLTSASA